MHPYCYVMLTVASVILQVTISAIRKIAQRTEGTTGAPDTSNLKTFFRVGINDIQQTFSFYSVLFQLWPR
ncbi:hypothetical protein SAMN05660649_01605 [Desulfotomaculum arcticum]|uniref:Uncharacterized protein n=1 Tax=Desulfotruncus arcticus DSM 17038 TaxID=1121424 RepID=A0A1I2RNF1_9FIRM|nr:hypothetical protein SAMN05660649_01605 [Desulfotomaculum arcticum] [Desulfotruncus arcticus DSM 17038]